MPTYIRPQVKVFQEFQAVPTTVVQNLNAFIFGPNYQLFRYAIAAEKAFIGLGEYDKDTETDYSYPNQPASSSIDMDYVALYMENVWAEYLAIPISAANPVNMVGANERNKLRASPIIGVASEGTDTGPADIAGVEMTSGGWFTGGVTLPENYYIYPTGGYLNNFMTDLTNGSGEDGNFAYITTEGVTGTFPVDAADNPLGAAVFTPGADGLQLNLLTGVDDAIQAPVIATFENSLGTGAFTLSLKASVMGTIIDWAVDDSTPVKLSVNLTGGANTVTWTGATKTLDILIDGAVTPATLAELRALLVADSDVATYFDVSAVTGITTVDVETVEDQAATDLADSADHIMLRDSYRIPISANPYIFKTGNGFTHTSQFKDRGVLVNDRVRYQVTDDLAVTHTGTTKVVSFEADQTLASVGDPSVATANEATQTGTDVATGVAIIAADAGNSRDFDGANTKLLALDAVNTSYTGSLLNGIVDDNFTVLITTPGVAGVARATVTNTSGTYSRTNVLIEVAGADDGQLYIGLNIYINFDEGAGDPDSVFQAGDIYTLSADVEAPFTAVASTLLTSAGTYIGSDDTTYIVEVTRGGVFDRDVDAIVGLNSTASATLTPSVSWAAWTGGDINDEYVLRCTSAGVIAVAQFTLESQQGDAQTLVQFGTVGTDVALGGRGLVAQLTEAGGPLTYAVGDYWVIKLNAARPQVRITDSAGVDAGSLTVVNDATAFALGANGATMTFAANTNTEGGFNANGGLLLGDVFYVAVTAAADGAIRTLVLADDLPAAVTGGLDADDVTNPAPNNFGTWLYLVQSSTEIESEKTQAPPDYNWEAAATEVTIYEDIAVLDSSWSASDYLPVYSADMYLEYRALLTDLSDTIYSISDINDVVTELGTVTPDNPLSQGVYNALANSGDRAVYYMAVPTDDLTGYSAVLDAASLSDEVYAFAPLTRTSTIQTLVEAHITAMSSATNKRWRIGFFGTELEREVVVYDLTTNPGAVEFFAEISDNPAVTGTQYTLVNFVDSLGAPSTYTNVLTDVEVGDELRINYATDAWGNAVYEEYTVASLLTDTSLTLTSGPSAAVAIPSKVEVWHPYSVAEMATAVAAVSTSFYDRRIYHTFPDQLILDGVVQTAEFGAAAVAGLTSSVVPQQGLTNIELNGFDDLPQVYSTFNQTQLDAMAGAGTLIIMQDIVNGRIYIRHQVSTATSSGDINQTELSVTKNLDSISYFFAGRLQPFIGRYNITTELLTVLRAQITDGLMFLGSFTSVGLLGPQVILTGTELVRLEQHPTLLDHVLATVNVQLPYPLNVIELTLVV